MRQMRKKIEDNTKETNFSGVIRITNLSNNSIIYENSSGYRNLPEKLPNNINTKFCTASGTKTFTALGIAKLIEMDKIHKNDKLSQHLKLDLKDLSDEITIDHLLTHTSGIYDYFDEDLVEDFDNYHSEIPWFKLKNVKSYLPLLTGREMKFRPGTKFCYSNSGYVILAILIQEISGMKYQNFIKEYILTPAQMLQSGFYYLNRLPENTAVGYMETENEIRSNIYNVPVIGGGDGGMYTTLEDINKFWKKLFKGKIVSPALVKDFITPINNAGYNNPNIFYGRGIWYNKDFNSNPMPYILGIDAGMAFKSQYFKNNEENLSVTIISNIPENGFWEILQITNEYFRNIK